MPFSETTTRKLSMLLPRLASDQDGDILSTTYAIKRVLEREGADFHDLAKALAGGGERVVYKTVYERQEPEAGEWLMKARFCAERENMLRSKEREFVHDMAAKLKWISEPSERQAAWLEAIYSRLRRQSRETA